METTVKTKSKTHPTLAALALALAPFVVPMSASAADASAAQGLARQNNCMKCHSVDQAKVGPAFKEVAAKYKGNKDAEAALVKHLTTGPKLTGGEGTHPVIKAKSPDDTKNLVGWILSL